MASILDTLKSWGLGTLVNWLGSGRSIAESAIDTAGAMAGKTVAKNLGVTKTQQNTNNQQINSYQTAVNNIDWKSILNSINTSAIQAEMAAADKVNQFNAQQAELNRLFQQNSAKEAMNFSMQEAAKERAFQEQSQAKAMAFNAQQAQQQMDYQTEMSNTIYQRAVKDLRQAGLSPLLAYGNMQTSAPSGASSSISGMSGAMGSGYTAGGSQANGVKANIASAKSADQEYILGKMKDLNTVLVAGMNNATRLIDALIPL